MEIINMDDHWAFLEEIEAPMWVDLALEAKCANKDIDDDWFRITHSFHQCSAHELKAAFADFDVRNLSSEFEIDRQPSPKIPSSVSRSRGKHYKSKKLRGEDDHFLTKQQHPVKALHGGSLYGKSGFPKEIKHKSSFTNAKQTSALNRVSFTKNAFTGKGDENGPGSISKHRGSENSSLTVKTEESNVSTITTESSQQSQNKIAEVSSQTIGNTSRLLSSMRLSLRNSCVTRQASRVENNKDKCLSGDIKSSSFGESSKCLSREIKSSSSGKSSIGSSHATGYDVKRSTIGLMQRKEQTPESRHARRMTNAAKSKINNSKISKASSNVRANFKRGVSDMSNSAAHPEASKSKVQNRTIHAKVALRDKVNARSSVSSTAKDKQKDKITKDTLISTAKEVQKARMIGVGKENATGRMEGIQNCSSRSMANSKDRNKKFIGAKGKRSSPGRKKNLTTGGQKVHFR